jgi:HEAT repeat protein
MTATSGQEARALAAALVEPGVNGALRWQGDSEKWILGRLGELRDPAAAGALFKQLARNPLYRISSNLRSTLSAIGGQAVEAGALKLLDHAEINVRRAAVNLLVDVQKEKARPLLRRMVEQPWDAKTPWGDKLEAINLLSNVGKPEDLPLLLPVTDFWNKGTFSDDALSAVANIRYRFNYDVNGPIHP